MTCSFQTCKHSVLISFVCMSENAYVALCVHLVLSQPLTDVVYVWLQVVAWYDNEWGYSSRVLDLAEITAKNWT